MNCKCGEKILRITDRTIVGEPYITWYVCPIILMGCDKKDHTSFYV